MIGQFDSPRKAKPGTHVHAAKIHLNVLLNPVTGSQVHRRAQSRRPDSSPDRQHRRRAAVGLDYSNWPLAPVLLPVPARSSGLRSSPSDLLRRLPRRLLGCPMLLARREASKEAEFPVLQHENAALRRETGR